MMRCKLIGGSIWLTALIFFMGCVSPSSTVTVRYKPTDNSEGYVYGRFVRNMTFGNTATFIIVKKDADSGELNEKFRISFLDDQVIPSGWSELWKLTQSNQVIALEPGTYMIESVEFISGVTKVIEAKKYVPPENYRSVFTVKPGQANYIGDFNFDFLQETVGAQIKSTWLVTDPKNNFEKTTKTVKKMYKFMRDMECHSVFE